MHPSDGFGISEHFGRAEIMRGSQGLPTSANARSSTCCSAGAPASG
ncbi:hypothetical protein [Streptomyces purpurascens]